jgi:hypothetical protein
MYVIGNTNSNHLKVCKYQWVTKFKRESTIQLQKEKGEATIYATLHRKLKCIYSSVSRVCQLFNITLYIHMKHISLKQYQVCAHCPFEMI